MLKSSRTKKKSTATWQMEKTRDPTMDLISVLNEASIEGRGEEEVHMDVNVVFGHQQEDGEPAGEEDLSASATGPLQEVDPQVVGLPGIPYYEPSVILQIPTSDGYL